LKSLIKLNVCDVPDAEEGPKLRDKCLALYADDKLLEAARLEKEVSQGPFEIQ
jgi:hypothetical protein